MRYMLKTAGKNLIFLACICMFWTCQAVQSTGAIADKYPVIPSPQELQYGGTELHFRGITIQPNSFVKETHLLETFFNEEGIKANSKGLSIQLRKVALPDSIGTEAYTVHISDKVIISASTNRGIFYGIQTLRQLFRKQKEKGVFPAVTIRDWPAFKMRGFMHDTGRNFQSISQLKEQIEILSQYKYNVFHWHLTDNPGWRLASKLYPQLQSETVTSRQKGKFYTQEEFKELLAFCKARHITVIPEFDIPGHTDAFRKALQIDRMGDPKVKPILLNLFKELMSLADADEMPFIHIGTDEVRTRAERISNDDIFEIMQLIRAENREVIVWKEGIEVQQDSTSINQLWAYHEGRKGHRFIDSRSNYINHLDPFAGMSRLFFQQPCRQPVGDEKALGGILAAWPDNNILNERDVLIQNPIYPSMVFYSDAIWKGRAKNYPEYWAKLPPEDTKEFNDFKAFEAKVIQHRDLFFQGKEFKYLRQTDKQWKLIGPFDHEGDFEKSFDVEHQLKEQYTVNGQQITWTDGHIGGTIHLRHFFGFPSVTDATTGTYYAFTNIYSPNDRVQDFWVGFQGWSRSGGRRGGPTPQLGEWHTTKPKIWVNATEIDPPQWKQPNVNEKSDEIPFIDEDYFYRSPTQIQLKKGWNKVLLKIPQGGNSWKWMFTCIPVNSTDKGVKEVPELKYNTKFDPN